MPKALKLPPLYPIVDAEVAARGGWSVVDLARAYLNGGATFLQLRAKSIDSAAFLADAEQVVADAQRYNAAVIVNDRADIAALAGAAGVHVGQDDLLPADVRKIIGAESLVGLSTHTDDQIEAALQQPISYFAIGPVFPTSTKNTGYDRVGYDAVRHAASRARETGVPVVAIGGITLETAPQVIAAGASAVAIITDLVTDDPEARVRQYLASLSADNVPGTIISGPRRVDGFEPI